jgi:hypothetical protein
MFGPRKIWQPWVAAKAEKNEFMMIGNFFAAAAGCRLPHFSWLSKFMKGAAHRLSPTG